MDTVKLKSLGMEGDGQEPSTVEEFDAIAKKSGTCLQRAREYVRFHVTLDELRDLFLHGRKGEPAADGKPEVAEIVGVEDLTGIARNTTPVLKDGMPVVRDGEVVTKSCETEGDYFKRVVAQLVTDGKFPNEEDAKASFQSLYDTVIAAVGFPASASEHKASAPKKLAAKYKVSAAMAIAVGTVDKINANQLSQIGKSFTATGDQSKMFTGTGQRNVKQADGSVKTEDVPFSISDKDAESLGWLLKEYFDWKVTQELNQ